MKRVLAFAVLILVLAGVGAPVHGLPKGLSMAHRLFVPIACTSPRAFRWKLGTGISLDGHFVMTAGHVNCHTAFPDMPVVEEISDDGGIHWVQVQEKYILTHPMLDLGLIYLPEVNFKTGAKFRAPIEGESVSSFGIAEDFISTFGRVLKIIDPQHVLTSTLPIGGMSGSAMVADSDGAVIGVTSEAIPVYVGDHVSGVTTLGVSGAVLGDLASTGEVILQSK